jgi:Uma2 family endonuclease
LLRDHAPAGRRITECSVETRDGVKVADVAWLSKAFFTQFGNVTPYPQAPEICVEIISPSNTPQAILEKIELYLEQGAVGVDLRFARNRQVFQQRWKPREIRFGSRIPEYNHARIIQSRTG